MRYLDLIMCANHCSIVLEYTYTVHKCLYLVSYIICTFKIHAQDHDDTCFFTGLSKKIMSSSVHYIFGFILFICLVILVCGTFYYYEYDMLNMWLKGTLVAQDDIHHKVKQVSMRRRLQRDTHGKKQIGTGRKSSRGAAIPPPNATSQHKTHGYVLSYRLYEQQTAATRNLWGLQYWAHSVNMKVVEPFVSVNTFNFCPIIEGAANPMRFGDLFDINYWNSQATEHGCAELVGWEDFLLNAPKTTILVFTKTGDASSPAGVFKEFTNPDKINGNRQCSGATFPAQGLNFFRNHNFQFVREVCIRFSSSTPMSMEQFSQYILGGRDPNSVTIIIALWHGIRNTRDHLKTPPMRTDNTVGFGLLPSIKMKNFSKEYMEKFNPGGGKYYGVMVRVERIFKNQMKRVAFTKDDVLKYLTECATNLTQHLNIHPEWSRTLAIDLGQYGSLHYRRGSKDKPEEILYAAFFNSIFGNSSITIDKFETSFKNYLNFDNAVVIAQLQRTIAVTSDCLVLIGGGSTFQAGALAMYKKLHPNEKDQCIIKHCYK